MFISEIFYSIQGEGKLTGVPSVFVRTSGCNLRCSWCDTKYASWSPEGEEMSVDAIVKRVLVHSAANHCVLTGGEPMLAKGIHELAAKLKSHGKHITIETAGTLLPDEIDCDLASLSPKLANSTPRADEVISEAWIERHEKARFRPEVLRAWIEHYDYQLKFVVRGVEDVEEIQRELSAIGCDIAPSKVLLMPEGVDLETIRSRTQMLAEICMRFGFRYCNRLQIELFGNKRGT